MSIPAIAAFLGWQFLHEHLSATQLCGMIIIIVGVLTLTLPGGGGSGDPNKELPAKRSA